MYLIATHIPIHTDGTFHYIDISWQRDLILARDWLARAYGGLTLIAPSVPLNAVSKEGMALVPIGLDDGIRVVPSFDSRGRARQFWLRDRHIWNADIRRELTNASVFHTSACDVFRPFTFMAHSAAVRAGVPSVFVGPDMDVHAILPNDFKGRLHGLVYDYWTKRALKRTNLGLLKEGLVDDRYHRFGKNVKAICHSMHNETDVISINQLEQRLHTLESSRPLRVVYAGRFVQRKGLRHALGSIALARKNGVQVEFHLYGAGPEEPTLRMQAKDSGISSSVFFHGMVEYGPAFIRTLAEFDVFLFMPTEEDSPRALFDTMAAGLPVVGTRIPFLKTRISKDHQGLLVDIGDMQAAADQLAYLHSNLVALGTLSRNARIAGVRHSVDEWYRLRREWTLEICEPASRIM